MDQINAWDLSVLLKLNHFLSLHNSFLDKFCAEYLTYSLPLILVILWFSYLWSKDRQKIINYQKTAARATASVIIAWPVLAQLIGHFVNRPRPFDAGGVQELVFHRPSVSFPSDHAATLFAVALSFYLSGEKKLSILMFIIAIVVSFFRVAVGIHWPTDILGGIVVGFVAALLIFWFDKFLNPLYEWIIKILSKVRLA